MNLTKGGFMKLDPLQNITVCFDSSGKLELLTISASSKKRFFEKVKKEAQKRCLDYNDCRQVSFVQTSHKWIDN